MAKGPVEIWLLDLLKVQMSSLHNIIRSAFYQISDSGFLLLPFLNHFPAQVRLAVQMWRQRRGRAQPGDGNVGGGRCPRLLVSPLHSAPRWPIGPFLSPPLLLPLKTYAKTQIMHGKFHLVDERFLTCGS